VLRAAAGRPLEKGPLGSQPITVLKRIVAGIRRRWPKTRTVFRADSHHTKPEVLDWLHAEDVDFVTGLAKNTALEALCVLLPGGGAEVPLPEGLLPARWRSRSGECGA